MSRIQTHCLALTEKQYTREITNEYRVEKMFKLFSINPQCIKYSVLCTKLLRYVFLIIVTKDERDWYCIYHSGLAPNENVHTLSGGL